MRQTRLGLVGFLLSFATLKSPAAEAHPSVPVDSTPPAVSAQNAEQTVEARLANLTARIREREQQLSEADQLNADELVAKGFADGDDRGWRRSRSSGWIDGRHGGEFRNSDPWRDGWRDGHRFFNWPD